MTSCLVLTPPAPDAPTLAADLEAAGIHVLGASERGKLVQQVVRLAPDVVVAHEAIPDAALFDAIALLQASAPRPVLLFTSDPDADKMKRALECGIALYVVSGYAPARLRPLVHLAQARYAYEQGMRDQLADVSSRFEERKLVDRAKGILMRARQLSEEEAFRVLRAASMQSNQRVGQVSQQLIAAAGLAEAINRAGQFRMLSQRIVKLQALHVAGAAASPLLAESCTRVDGNLAILARSLSPATYGDLLEAIRQPWALLRTALATPADAARLGEVDALANRMLVQADRLVNALETAGAASRLHVINVCGRQRMLSQRWAQQALLSALLRDDAATAAGAGAAAAADEFAQALVFLNAAPLTTREIRQSLDDAERLGTAMKQACAKVASDAGRQALADTSEALLALFEQLTERYERSMQMLMG